MSTPRGGCTLPNERPDLLAALDAGWTCSIVGGGPYLAYLERMGLPPIRA